MSQGLHRTYSQILFFIYTFRLFLVLLNFPKPYDFIQSVRRRCLFFVGHSLSRSPSLEGNEGRFRRKKERTKEWPGNRS